MVSCELLGESWLMYGLLDPGLNSSRHALMLKPTIVKYLKGEYNVCIKLQNMSVFYNKKTEPLSSKQYQKRPTNIQRILNCKIECNIQPHNHLLDNTCICTSVVLQVHHTKLTFRLFVIHISYLY